MTDAIFRGGIIGYTEDGKPVRISLDHLQQLDAFFGNQRSNSVGKILSGLNQARASITDVGGYYAIKLGAGNAATFELLADGTAASGAIVLSASEITLSGDAINLGDDTQFETTDNSFITETGGYRYRYGGPFGTSSDLLQWFGADSVAEGSETKTNGVFAMATDGKVYFGSTPAGAMTGAKLDQYYVVGFTSGGLGYSGTVEAMPIGGDGTYTYQWTRTAEAGANRVTCSSTTIAEPTFSVAAGGSSRDTWTCTVSEPSSGFAVQASVTFDISLI